MKVSQSTCRSRSKTERKFQYTVKEGQGLEKHVLTPRSTVVVGIGTVYVTTELKEHMFYPFIMDRVLMTHLIHSIKTISSIGLRKMCHAQTIYNP